MIWIIVALLLILLLIYGLGTFLPHRTHICVINIDREIDQCFALVTSMDHFVAQLHDVDKIELIDQKILSSGSRGIIHLHGKPHPFEVVDFIPNYRISVAHQGYNESWKLQLSFYRESKTNTRLVLIAMVESSSHFRRVWNTIQKKKRVKKFSKLLVTAKSVFEKTDEVLPTYNDVTPEKNPNFSLK